MPIPDASVEDTFSTTVLMSTSAIFMGGLGIGISLFPQEMLSPSGLPQEGPVDVLLSVLGALYLGFAAVNWMARKHLIGGIYSRPVAIGNFIHFFAAAIALGKYVIVGPNSLLFVGIVVAYGVFAAGFGYVAFAAGSSCG